MKNSSDYFKLKKIKVTKLEKIIALVLVLIVSFIYFIYPIDIQNVAIFQDSSENVMSILKSFDFPGILQQQTVFSNGYVNVVYFNEGKLDSHLININKRQEVSLNDFLKDDCETKFSQKEEELLLLKFPKKIVELLLADQDKTYIFNDEYLHITYNAKDVIASTRNFDLKIYYKHIANYLEFNVVVDDSAIDENGFAYDPNKISVSFTFDDGPNGKNTQTLISALEDYKMTATFFMVGNKLNNDRQTVKMVADSHSEI